MPTPNEPVDVMRTLSLLLPLVKNINGVFVPLPTAVTFDLITTLKSEFELLVTLNAD